MEEATNERTRPEQNEDTRSRRTKRNKPTKVGFYDLFEVGNVVPNVPMALP